jgi:cell division protein FtsI (penicillin-binding protein 3)
VPTSLWVRGKEENGICVVNEQRLSKEKVPNVIGLTIKDAIYMLENLGMKVKFSGKGKVVRQSIAPGTKFDKKNSVIVLELQSADRVN